MSVGYAAAAQRLHSQTVQAAERGSEALRAHRAETAARLRETDRAKSAVAAAVDGMFQLYDKNSQVVAGIKENAVAGTAIDVRA